MKTLVITYGISMLGRAMGSRLMDEVCGALTGVGEGMGSGRVGASAPGHSQAGGWI